MMRVSIIVAMAENRVIGRAGDLPWRIPGDLRRFKELTMGKPIIMGRKTYQSIGRALPGRLNIVITRDAAFSADNVTVANDLDQAFVQARQTGTAEAMVIGGGDIYRQALGRAETIHLTEVHMSMEGDTWFPELDPAEWTQTAREPIEAEDEVPAHTFVTVERVVA